MASKYTVNQVKAEEDYLVHLKEENCPRYKQIIESASSNADITQMTSDMNRFFSSKFYGRLADLTGLVIQQDPHTKVRDICTSIYWMQQSEIELAFEMTDEDQNMCRAIHQLSQYVREGLFSKEAELMKVYEFVVIMRDFADLTAERRGLFFNTLPFMKYFRDNYYTEHLERALPGKDVGMYPEFLHFAGHQRNVQAILSFLGYEGAAYKTIHPGTTITFEFMRVQYAKKQGEKASQSETHIQVLLNTFDSEGTIQSEILSVRGCDAQASGGVKAQCFQRSFDATLSELSKGRDGERDIRQWCAEPYDVAQVDYKEDLNPA